MKDLVEPGVIVYCRNRQWVVLPSDDSDLIRLRPLSGNESQICGIFTPLESSLEPAQFPPPEVEAIQDQIAARLLIHAARLSLRSGAGPFRCLGRLSVRPRPYQLVPLLIALRLEIVRLLIADDVGIGKTIEAGLIARELLDRREAKRLLVLCPPQLCDQWQRELQEKFHIDAVVVRSGTVSKLERGLPSGDSHIFSYYPHLIVSLDYAKSDRRRASLLTHCPDLVIVDEAHTCTNAGQETSQQRHQLIQEIAKAKNRHLILLTATPHSGIEASFLSLLGLLKPEFEQLDLNHLTETQRKELARYFVQRRRVDVKQWLDSETPFPQREPIESAYNLSAYYRQLFEQVYDFARGLVRAGDQTLSYAQKRGRYWSALAIIRCVMSSPAAAVATLSRQTLSTADLDELASDVNEEVNATAVYDLTEQEQIADAVPISVVEKGKQTYSDAEKRKLREFVKAAEQLQGKKDTKLATAIAIVQQLLEDGYNPIIWCRYIATANYVAAELKQKLETKKNSKIRVIAITGEHRGDEREVRLAELKEYPQRVMVATDCLSEGVNLQDHFTAVIHYDLPWNPNRLEQREGRIDRYGQTASTVKCYLLYGADNPVDGAVLEVLIRKAVAIHKTLGVTVPIPMDSNTVQEAVFKSLFEQSNTAQQLSIFELLEETPAAQVHQNWDRAVEKEKLNRTRFAQRTIKPEEVKRELIESDQVLGDEADVEWFVKNACERLNASLRKTKQGWHLPHVPHFLQPILGDKPRDITFSTGSRNLVLETNGAKALQRVEYVGRNHPLVEGLVRHILEEALDGKSDEPTAARCGLTVTNAVEKPTTLLLLRLRYLLESGQTSRHLQALEEADQESRQHQSLLIEECFIAGFTGSPTNPNWIDDLTALELLETAETTSEYPIARKKDTLQRLRERLDELQPELNLIAKQRAEQLSASHRRVRQITNEGSVKVKPQLPMDILGLYILQPDH